jgi:uncharacterized membrane protein YfcA
MHLPDFSSLLAWLQAWPAGAGIHWISLAIAFIAVAAAYTVFTLVGFGTALFAAGPLAQVMAVERVVPMLALLDFAGSATRGLRARSEVVWREFARLLPGMLLGQLAGAVLLARLPPLLLALALGGFICLQGIKGLLDARQLACASAQAAQPAQDPQATGRGSPLAPFARGLFGGILGGLFGSGGFVYAAYLERRLESRAAFRATQAALIALSTAWRIVLCALLGLIDAGVLLAAAACVPAMLAGVYLGHRIDLKLDRTQLFALLNGLLVASGAALVLRQV